MCGGLRDKRSLRPRLMLLILKNYSTVEIVDHTLPVIGPKAIYWSRIAIFA